MTQVCVFVLVQDCDTPHDTADPLLDAWKGAAAWASEPSNSRYFISHSDYSEMGSDFFREHVAANMRVTPPVKEADDM